MTRPVGIRDVARVAGVSKTTVSHSLNGKGRIPDSTRDRVREVAEELGYRPNPTARNLATARTGLIGLAVSQSLEAAFAVSDFAYYAQLMSAATVAAMDLGYALVLASGVSPKETWDRVALDGAIVVDPVRSDPVCESFRNAGIPFVTAGRDLDDTEASHVVDNDHAVGTRSILDHLAARGASRVALVTSPPVTSYAADARSAYEDWCADRHQTPVIAETHDDLTEGAGFQATSKLLSRRRRPDAIYATLDRLALGALLAAQAEGIAVPRDLLVAGCTDSDAGQHARPSLTALALNPDAIGRALVGMIVELIETGAAPENVAVPTRVLPRSSTRRKRVESAAVAA